MLEECKMVYDDVNESMQKAIDHLEYAFHKIRAGKASPDMLDGVMIDYYGTMTPLHQTANISTPDSSQIIVQPWDKSIIGLIEKAILAANLGFNPSNEGEIIRIKVPALTGERREELVKIAKHETENAKISIRNIRRSGNDDAKALEKDGTPEDDVKRLMDDIQKLTDDYSKKAEELLTLKEKEITTI
jgi:ribosome recycling factor